ncbi:MAG: hypothetical protein JW749_04055 [Sedimentisphaerales bacterium]|nr:hypothetical protein [Sedimentisphaerales bacterium]
MNEGQSSSAVDIEFRYPKLPWVFTLACHIVMLVFLIIFTFGEIPLQFFWAYIVFIATYIFIISVHVWDWMGWVAGTRGPVIIGAEGIKVGEKFAEWDQIEEIKHGIWLNRTGGIRLKLKKEKRPFFEFILKTKPKALFIQAYPFVYRELVPVIKTIRPDLSVSPIVERAMKNPEDSIAPRRWLLTIIFAANIALLTALLMPRFQSLIPYLFIALMLSLVGSYLKPWAFKLIQTERDKFIEFAFHCTILVYFGAGLRAFTPIEPIYVNTIIIMAITALLLASAVLFAVKELTNGLKIVILCVLAGVPTAAYAYNRSQEWPSKNISGLLCGDEIRAAVWGNCGRFFTTVSYEGRGCVIDAGTLERKFVLEHEGSVNTIWLDEKTLIRHVTLEDVNDDCLIRELWVYDFNQQQEFKVPTSRRFSIGARKPVDITSRRIAWIDYGQNVQTLRFYNIETMNEDMEAVELLKDVNWVGGKAEWISERELAVYVGRADEGDEEKNRRLYVLRMNLQNGSQVLWKSSQKYERLYPVNEFKNAFDVNELEKFEKYSSDFLSLREEKIIHVAGDDFPLEARQAGCAFYVVEGKTGAYLIKFDFGSGQARRLFSVPKAMRIQGVSSSGRFVLLGLSGFMDFPTYMVIDITGGKRHWIKLSGMSFGSSSAWSASMPGRSPFSADEQWLILETFSTGGFQTVLYEIPEKW